MTTQEVARDLLMEGTRMFIWGCPRCHSWRIEWSHRRNTWEALLCFIRVYPIRCQDCKHRFLRFSLQGR
jgi:hypothetical protein